MDAIRGWMPFAIFAMVGGASVAVLQINHQRMLATMNGTVAAVDNLTHARLAVTAAYLSSEQIEAGDPTFAPAQVISELTRAADLVEDLREGRTSLLATRRGVPLRDSALVAASRRYGEAIAGLRTRLLSGVPLDPAERRSAYAAIDDAAAHLEHELYDALSSRLAREDRKHRVWMFGWASFLFATAVGLLTLGREHRRADEARERAERSRARSLKDLGESERRNSTLLQAIPDLIFRHTRTGEYLDFQAPEGTRDLYVPPEEIRGRKIHDVLPQEVADALLLSTEQALASGAIQRFEYALPMPEGTQSYEARLVPSGPDEVLTLVRNVTEQKRAEERERALLHERTIRAEAEARNRAKNDFLSRMSHELRTPLNAILGFGQLLEMESGVEEDQESVQQILKAGQHLLSLIDEVLDIARIEAGQMSLSVEPVSVRSVVAASVDLVRLTAAKRGIVIDAQSALASEHFVGADEQRLKQALLNFLSNAIKYNRPEGSVTVSCEEVGEDRLRISVRDCGYGIPAERMERLFTPFDRLGADATGVEGTGLGLALSKGLIEAMGGRIGAESVEGEGSHFWTELPLAPPQQVADRSSPKRPKAAPRADAGATHTILFVEDNLANVRLMERVLQRRPQVRLITAMQGGIALDLARAHRPDLILLDLDLPDLSGEEVLLSLRKEMDLRDTPIVMVSGNAIPAQVQRMLDLGARAYLTKPFQIREVLDLVDEQLAAGTSRNPARG